ncbi:MAG: ATP-binding protein, partial [Vicinamibacteria bacterium]
MQQDFDKTLAAIDQVSGTRFAAARPRDPEVVFELLDRYILHKLAEEPSGPTGPSEKARKSLALLIRYLETITPAVEGAHLTGELGANLIKVLHWANDPTIRLADVTLALVTENLGELHPRISENPFISKIEIPLPEEAIRRRYAREALKKDEGAASAIARESNGLTLVALSQAVGSALADGGEVDPEGLRQAKKELIEKQCFGLVEFVAPEHGLSAVVTERAVKERLEQDVELFRYGRFDALPMGYLLCGAIGTGKTFTATCFAGSLGIPAIVFKNLRSKWVGSSEGNLQKVLSVVKALGPVVVIIDEADAALGTRALSGDSGTSSRMFAMISSLMSDTRYRGRILWMLLTCRPDLLPVDLKRQGRCEVHIPLFPPSSEDDRREMFLALAKKAGTSIAREEVPPIPAGLSGADIESLLVQSIRRAALSKANAPGAGVLKETLAHFRAPEYGLEKELQELVAIREATDASFVPEPLRNRYGSADKAAALERRIQEILGLMGSAAR